MLTQHKIKILQSLDKRKFRQKYNLFLVEGNKIIRELPDSKYKIQEIYTTTPDYFKHFDINISEITSNELKKISFLQHPKDSIAVCELLNTDLIKTNINIILDGIQDPGNLGTIIRLADWFGVQQIICSKETADYFNPKVIQASMGSFTRVNIVYTDIQEYIKNSSTVSFTTDMEGESIYKTNFPNEFNLILGNEGNGVSNEIMKLTSNKITIPRFSTHQSTESLNVAMATGIILGEIFSKGN